MKRRIFAGAATALVTPMKENGEIDYPALERLLDFQIEQGPSALVAVGTTGEASTLSDREKLKVAEVVIRKAGGRLPVIVGTGSNDTRHAVKLSREAQNLGADGLLVVTPYYNKTSQEGLIRHYFQIADQVCIPVILYNVPTRTCVNICPETCRRLAEHPNICAVKEAGGNLSQVAEIAALCREELDIYSGNDDQILPVLSLGGKGVISVAGNLVPGKMEAVCRLYMAGKQAESLALQLELLDLMNAMFWDVNPVPVKAALEMMGLCREVCRLPLVPLDRAKKERLRGLLASHGLVPSAAEKKLTIPGKM